MKQFQIQYEDNACFEAWLDDIRNMCAEKGLTGNAVLFRIFSVSCETQYIEPVIASVRRYFPDAVYIGSSGDAVIVNARTGGTRVVVTATVCEYPDTKIEVLQFPMTYETQDDSANALMKAVEERPWVKAVEMMTTLSAVDMPKFCERVSGLPENIAFYGGGALAQDVENGTSEKTIVFSSASDRYNRTAAFVLHGGPQLNVHTQYITGWRRLGRPFEVTAAQNNVLLELNGMPALDLYHRYLQLPKDEHFYEMAVVFPFCFEENGLPFLRVPVAFLDNGALILGADIKVHTTGNIAYGDPAGIMEAVNRSLDMISGFAPDTIQLFSCASRKFYWGPEVDRETVPFESLAPTSGFYTAGEILRINKDVIMHNVTMVIAALREGSKTPESPEYMEGESFSRPLMINKCLTSFINVASEELEEVNRKLSIMAITDGLTGLFNRLEIERRVREALSDYQKDPKEEKAPAVVMLDLDYFKNVNDSYGHQEGDDVLRKLAELLRKSADEAPEEISVGRWGGEEFLLLIRGMDINRAGEFAERIRKAFSDICFPLSGKHTLSSGVAFAALTDTGDSLIGRADKGLYRAKDQGRNKSIIEPGIF